jgi:hypothetical protein
MAIGTTVNSQANIPVGGFAGGGGGTGIVSVLGQAPKQFSSHDVNVSPDTVFAGYVRVDKLLNGYVVHFARSEGSISLKYVALTIKEVNEIITSEMVQFKLES